MTSPMAHSALIIALFFCLVGVGRIRCCIPAEMSAKLCGGSHTLSRGSTIEVKTPEVNLGQSCAWLINVKSGCTTVLTCSSFLMPVTKGCTTNFLELVDGSVIRVRYCGKSNSLRYVSKGRSVFDIKSKVSSDDDPAAGFQCRVQCKEDEVVPTTTTEVATTTTTTTTTSTATEKISNCQCGWSTLLERIIGGEDVGESGFYPWHAAIVFSGVNGCGAALISPWYLLTAAHCTKGREPAELEVWLGRRRFRDPEEGEQRIKIEDILEHPKFNSTSLDNDFSLLKLEKAATITDQVKPVCLPTDPGETYGNGLKAVAVGWGSTKATKLVRPDILQQIKVETWPKGTCGKFKPSQITENMLCAGGETKDACQGDSGG